jgi:hypothetical protein
MLILLKMASFAIWLVIMTFIIMAGIRKSKAAMPDVSSYLCQDSDKTREFRNHRLKI